MNQIQVVNLINTLSIPAFYSQAPEGTSLPFIVIHSEEPDNFSADNVVYCEKWNFRIDLYTAKKDLKLERDIKNLLSNNSIFWVKTEEFISDQATWEVEFSFQVLGNEEQEE